MRRSPWVWLRKGFGFAGAWTVCEQNQLLAVCFGLPKVNKSLKGDRISPSCGLRQHLRQAPIFVHGCFWHRQISFRRRFRDICRSLDGSKLL